MANDLRYCQECKQNVFATMKINWIIFIILLLLGFIFGIIYFVYCYISSSHRMCPVCKSTSLYPPKTEKFEKDDSE